MSTMRRGEKEIRERAVLEEILRENQVGRLATAVDGRPYVVPMNFVYTNGSIFLHTHRDGKKVKDIQRNPRVCFEVDSGEIIAGDDPKVTGFNDLVVVEIKVDEMTGKKSPA